MTEIREMWIPIVCVVVAATLLAAMVMVME
jgi:hypothetical protein